MVLTQNKDDLLKSFVRTEPIHWIRTTAESGEKLECKLRHGPSRVEVYIHQEDHGAVIEFLTPQEAPTPGQYIVLYEVMSVLVVR